jgi:hypothetical protein
VDFIVSCLTRFYNLGRREQPNQWVYGIGPGFPARLGRGRLNLRSPVLENALRRPAAGSFGLQAGRDDQQIVSEHCGAH